jgi:hypothetical protein
MSASQQFCIHLPRTPNYSYPSMSPLAEELHAAGQLLSCFGDASGLQTNLSKSAIMPIRCEELNLDEVLPAYCLDLSTKGHYFSSGHCAICAALASYSERPPLSAEPNVFRWSRTANGLYSASSAYSTYCLGSVQASYAKLLWRS